MAETPDPMYASREAAVRLLRMARGRFVRVVEGATIGNSRSELIDQARELARRAALHGTMVGDEDLARFANLCRKEVDRLDD